MGSGLRRRRLEVVESETRPTSRLSSHVSAFKGQLGEAISEKVVHQGNNHPSRTYQIKRARSEIYRQQRFRLFSCAPSLQRGTWKGKLF
jgi:hypothetical protein